MTDKTRDILLPGLGVVFSAGGLAGFIFLFVREMNVFWFILSPMILAVYQIPAAFIFYLWKKKRRKIASDHSGDQGREMEKENGAPDGI